MMLTADSIKRMSANDIIINPLLQVISLTKITTFYGHRFRVELSDGQYYIQGILSIQCSKLVDSNQIKTFFIIRLKEFVCYLISGKKICIVIGCDVVEQTMAIFGHPRNIRQPLWMRFTPLPQQKEAKHVININPNEFIVVSHKSIFQYNVESNKFFEYPNNKKLVYNIAFSEIAFNKTEHEIYFYDKSFGEIQRVDLKTNMYTKFECVPYGSCFSFIENNFHIIHNRNKYWIGSIQNNTLNCLSDTLSNATVTDLFHVCAIYLPSKQSILLVGGYGYDVEADYRYAISQKFWIYSLLSKKWNKVENIAVEAFGFGAVLTSDQRYVIFFGGYETNSIFVLDMKDDNNWQIKRSNIVCPKSGTCSVTTTGGIDNKMLVIGYIKKCFKAKEFKHILLPPTYLMLIIYKYYNGEIIHWLRDNEHHAIDLNDILSSLIE